MSEQKEVASMENPKIRIQVASPMYGGMATGVYIQSLLELSGVCAQHGIKLTCAPLCLTRASSLGHATT
jgi:hypothetical protein